MLKKMNTEAPMCERPSEPDVLAGWLVDSAPPRPLGASGAFTSTLDGTVVRVDPDNLWLQARAPEDGADELLPAPAVAVCHELPSTVDLRPLVGRTVHATMVLDDGGGDRPGRTLIITDEGGRAWLIARTGPVQGVRHAVSVGCGAPSLQVALSQRPLGPLVIGTSELQWLVPLGQSAFLRMPDGSVFRAMLIKRRKDGTASYVIADESLFADRAS